MTPSAALMKDCPETRTVVDEAADALAASKASPTVTNGDLVMKIRSLRVDLRNCNADKAALREWSVRMAQP